MNPTQDPQQPTVTNQPANSISPLVQQEPIKPSVTSSHNKLAAAMIVGLIVFILIFTGIAYLLHGREDSLKTFKYTTSDGTS